MRRRTGLMTYVFAGCALLATVACENTRAGAEKDAEIAAEQAKEASAKAADATERAAEKTAEATDRAAEKTAEVARDAADATKQAAERAAEGTAEAKRDTVKAADAATTTASVKGALMAEKAVDATRIDVDTDGPARVVTLRGSVPNEAQRASAERIARAKAPGYTVVNELKVG